MNKKYKSRRYIVTVWTMALLTFIIVYALTKNIELGWIGSVVAILAAVPSAYIAADSYTNGKGKGDAQ